MRRRRKLQYIVWTQSDYWWVPRLRKWLLLENCQGLPHTNAKHCRTFDQARRIANKCPGFVRIDQDSYHRGHRWTRSYYVH